MYSWFQGVVEKRMTKSGIDFSSRVMVPDRVIAKALEDEMVLLDLASETYFGLNEMATAMWQQLVRCATIEEAYETLLEEYDVSPEVLRADLEELLQQLVESRIVELSGP